MTLTIAEALSEDDRAACYALRRAVFMEEQNVSKDLEFDGLDDDAHHLLARLDGTAVGTLRLRAIGDTAKIERVCVSRAARGTGLGAALTEAALDLARTLSGVTQAQLSAQVQVIDFYARHDFAPYGEVYLDADIPHRDMSRPL